jgi:hypothetical protein
LTEVRGQKTEDGGQKAEGIEHRAKQLRLRIADFGMRIKGPLILAYAFSAGGGLRFAAFIWKAAK